MAWGKKTPCPKILDEDTAREWCRALQTVDIVRGPYTHLDPGPGALVYLDPPYVDTFTRYTKWTFGHLDQVALLVHVDLWRRRGATVVYSNSWAAVDLVRVLWPDAEIRDLSVAHTISRDGAGRRAREMLAVAGPRR